VNLEPKRNIGHSIFQKLLNHARMTGEDFNLLLARYGVERFLYRLSLSVYSEKFILKGASLFLVWMGRTYRVTRDADLLGFGPADPEHLTGVFKEVCKSISPGTDGIEFDEGSIQAVPIREDQLYDGIRVTFIGLLHKARIPMQIDVGFGDTIIPAPIRVEFPTILGYSAPILRAYSRYTMAAEKIDAMIRLGMVNSRMKDFYDIWLISRIFEFEGTVFLDSIKNTFERRATQIPADTPIVFTDEFRKDYQKKVQWQAFIRKSRPENAIEIFSEVMEVVSQFVIPPINAIQNDFRFNLFWPKTGPWSPKKKR